MKWLRITLGISVPVLLAGLLLVITSFRPVSGADAFTVIAQANPNVETDAVRSAISYQGVAALNGTPLNGTRTVNFALSTKASCDSTFGPVALQVNFVDGVFSAVVPVPAEELIGQALWLKATTLDDQTPPAEVLFGCDEILPVPYAIWSSWSSKSDVSAVAASLAPYSGYLTIPMDAVYPLDVGSITEPASLPHGATIKRFTTNGQCFEAEFVRINLATGAKETLAMHKRGGGAGATTTAPVPNPVVDNVNYSYAVEAKTDLVAVACQSFADWNFSNFPRVPLYGVTIEYLTTHP